MKEMAIKVLVAVCFCLVVGCQNDSPLQTISSAVRPANLVTARQDLRWAPAPDLPTPRHDLAVTLGADGLVYAIGGWAGPRHHLNTVVVFDEKTAAWREDVIGPIRENRAGAKAVTDSRGRIWVIGGSTGAEGSYLDSVERYDPATKKWEIVGEKLLSARAGMGVTVGHDDSIYVFGGGGRGDPTALKTAEKYDPVCKQWLRIAPMNERRCSPGYAQDKQGRIYAIGGQNEVDLKTVERYDPSRNKWSDVTRLPDDFGSVNAAFALNGEIWVVGGWYRFGFTNRCRIYTPDPDPIPNDPYPANSWREGPPMYESLGGAGVAVGFSGTPYLVGGQRSGGVASNHVAKLVPQDRDQVEHRMARLSDGFNSYANGAPPVPPWTEFYAGPGSTPVYTREQAAARGVTITVQDSVSWPSDPPKSVHFLDTNGQVDSRLSIQFPSASSVTLTYCMRTDNANYEGVFVELTGDVGRDYSATFSNGAAGGRAGYIGIHGSTGWVKRDLLPYTTGTWYEVRRVLDCTANTGTFYVKDLATQREVSWQIGRDEANSLVKGILMWSSLSQGADTYIDCVRVTP